MPVPPRRVALLTTPTSYRTAAFTAAAQRLGLEPLVFVDTPQLLAQQHPSPFAVDFSHPEEAADSIAAVLVNRPVLAVLPVDDSGALVAAMVAQRLGLPQNDPEAALAARDKLVMRQKLQAGGVPIPSFVAYPASLDPTTVADQQSYPCVVKPTRLSGSRGVIRVDDPASFVKAFRRVQRILIADGFALDHTVILTESFIPGVEVALEGLLTNGQLHVLALFDKPDPLDGPFFEETIYVTPSRLPQSIQEAIADCTEQAARSLGLRTGPVHAELRVNGHGPWVIELAGRTIGGLCSTILEFGTGMSLEELILRHATGEILTAIDRQPDAVGVMMIPIPGAGILRRVEGIDEARCVPGITGIEITAKLHAPLTPLPEGASYLGFIFARAATPEAVESALREAHRRLRFSISPEIPLIAISTPPANTPA